MKISDSVIQGYAQYGVRAGIQRGGYGGFELDNVYEEVGSCTNPAGAIGEAGVIAQGATVKVEGTVAPAGTIPQFANSGSTDYRYYVVAHNTTYGASNPLYAGHALTNGSGNITVTTPDIAGATTFDLLRVTYLAPNNPREQAPFGTGELCSRSECDPHFGLCERGLHIHGHASDAAVLHGGDSHLFPASELLAGKFDPGDKP